MRNTLIVAALAAAAACTSTPVLTQEGAGPGESSTGMAMQIARAEMMTQRGMQTYYDPIFDLSDLPEYEPAESLSGQIVLMGSNYMTDGMIAGLWEDAFKQHHPDVEFVWDMKTSRAVLDSVSFGLADIGIGREADFGDIQLFQRMHDGDPLFVEIATGSYDVPGWQPAYGVVVHKDNPLTEISMEQLDGIFGSERNGGWQGTDWHPEWARGPEEDIRNWGQMGLTGEWADQPITPYGLNLRYNQASLISNMVLKSSDKWNEDLKIYANYVTADGQLARNMNADLAADPYGIGILAAPTTTLGGGDSDLKILPLGQTSEGPFVPYTIETLQDRSYPMFDQIFAYMNPDNDNAAAREFLKFVVSREGQELIQQDGKYLPFTAEVSQAQLDILNAASQ